MDDVTAAEFRPHFFTVTTVDDGDDNDDDNDDSACFVSNLFGLFSVTSHLKSTYVCVTVVFVQTIIRDVK